MYRNTEEEGINGKQQEQETLVSIVGAGPGDPKLLTIKAMECLRRADALFYDALVNPIILSYCREDCERIPVGKRAGRHSFEQPKINQLLVERALKGGYIVRLKGGDPFVFGRGGEEVLALKEAGIPFEIVPGLTAGITVPAYAGIPMTHREMSRSITFITASVKQQEQYALPWRALAELRGSVAFYMGCRVIPDIATHLIEAGLSPSTPAAILSEGTLPTQRKLVATLGEFQPGFTDYKSWAPGLFVVGEVVQFHHEFDFYFPSRVSQYRLLCVTMDREHSSLSEYLGGQVAYLHTMNMVERKIKAHFTAEELHQLLEAKRLFFTTPMAVDAMVQMLLAGGKDLRSLTAQLLVGSRITAQQLAKYGLRADLQLSTPAELDQLSQDGSKVLILSADDTLAERWKSDLERKGITTSLLLLYEEEPKVYRDDYFTFLRDLDFTHIIFSSSRAIDRFVDLAEGHQLQEMLEQATLITYGEKSQKQLSKRGYTSIAPEEGRSWSNQEVAAYILERPKA